MPITEQLISQTDKSSPRRDSVKKPVGKTFATLTQMFFYKHCEILRAPIEEHLHTAASEVSLGSHCLRLSFWTVVFKTILI